MITAKEALTVTKQNETYQDAVRIQLERIDEKIRKAASEGKRKCVLLAHYSYPEYQEVKKVLVEHGFSITKEPGRTIEEINW